MGKGPTALLEGAEESAYRELFRVAFQRIDVIRAHLATRENAREFSEEVRSLVDRASRGEDVELFRADLQRTLYSWEISLAVSSAPAWEASLKQAGNRRERSRRS